MPLDVIMPALGMAQETGQIVAWHKQPGDAVAKGDVLFEVETDKSTVEVEAQADGFLTDVSANKGMDVPVGQVIAKISDSAESAPQEGAKDGAAAATDALPEGKQVIMPTLGMAQDTGLLVKWHKAAGDPVATDDILFEVETDKSTVEVNAGADGFLAALLAGEGEEVPVGMTIAIISAEAPANPVTRKTSAAPVASKTAQPDTDAPPTVKQARPQAKPVPAKDRRILASPKLRRLAREQQLDLARLVEAGYPQPFHVKDLELLKSLPSGAASGTGTAQTASCLTAEISTEGFTAFSVWACETADLPDPSAILAGFCAASMGKDVNVAVETPGEVKTYAACTRLRATEATDAAPQIRLRDLRFTAITTVQVGAEEVPTLTLTRLGEGLSITFEFAKGHLNAKDAISLLSNFAGRMEQPLRHLL